MQFICLDWCQLEDLLIIESLPFPFRNLYYRRRLAIIKVIEENILSQMQSLLSHQQLKAQQSIETCFNLLLDSFIIISIVYDLCPIQPIRGYTI